MNEGGSTNNCTRGNWWKAETYSGDAGILWRTCVIDWAFRIAWQICDRDSWVPLKTLWISFRRRGPTSQVILITLKLQNHCSRTTGANKISYFAVGMLKNMFPRRMLINAKNLSCFNSSVGLPYTWRKSVYFCD